MRFRWAIPRWCVMALLLSSALCGCSQGARSLSLDKDIAHQSFEQFLKAWQEGKTPTDLQTGSPAIVCGDYEWRNGRKLVKYEVLSDETSDGTNLQLSAKLTLELDNKRIETRTVSYLVGTSPVITIFQRDEPAG